MYDNGNQPWPHPHKYVLYKSCRRLTCCNLCSRSFSSECLRCSFVCPLLPFPHAPQRSRLARLGGRLPHQLFRPSGSTSRRGRERGRKKRRNRRTREAQMAFPARTPAARSWLAVGGRIFSSDGFKHFFLFYFYRFNIVFEDKPSAVLTS